MPRRPTFTPEEDAILLVTESVSYEATNRRLEAAGFPARDPTSIKNRRNYLHRKMESVSSEQGPTSPDHVAALSMRRSQLLVRKEELEEQVRNIDQELEVITRQLHAALG